MIGWKHIDDLSDEEVYAYFMAVIVFLLVVVVAGVAALML